MFTSAAPLESSSAPSRRFVSAFGGGAVIGALGGMIGLGGAEFRLPLLIGLFAFPPLESVILNKAMSLVVVASALPFRSAAVPFSAIADHWSVIANLLAGSWLGAWFGAGWATQLKSETLYKVIAALLVLIAVVLLLGHDAAGAGHSLVNGPTQIAAGVVSGFAIGVVAALEVIAGPARLSRGCSGSPAGRRCSVSVRSHPQGASSNAICAGAGPAP